MHACSLASTLSNQKNGKTCVDVSTNSTSSQTNQQTSRKPANKTILKTGLPRLFFNRAQVDIGYTFFSQIRKYDILTPLQYLFVFTGYAFGDVANCPGVPLVWPCVLPQWRPCVTGLVWFEKDREVACSTRCNANSEML
jgi:hypothetical protein